MKKLANILSRIISLFVVFVAGICVLLEVMSYTVYSDSVTAGGIFACLTANQYEGGDLYMYCSQYILGYIVGSIVIWVFVMILEFWLQTRKEKKYVLWGAVLSLCSILPFAIPGLPTNLFREGWYAYHLVDAIKQYRNDNRAFAYNAVKVDTLSEQEVYVWAIGESVRYRNWALNGEYCRQTTPRLQEQSNLVLYSDYYANATLTQYALPMMLTGTQPGSFAAHFQRKTVAAAFAETGFRTALVSHRAQLMNNGWHGYLTTDFDTVVWVEHDSLIAPTLLQLTATGDKWFVVTHYLGNHFFYTNRTDDCLQWRPDYNADSRAKSDSLFLNAYDNSLLYTDRMLSEAIRILEQTDAVSAWLFVSDHGEYIDKRVSGHGYTYHPTKEEYHVPLMVWYSNAYKATYPRKVSNMAQHKDMPFSADCVLGSLLDMANIRVTEDVQSSIFADSVGWSKRTLLLPDGERMIEL